MAKSIIDVEGFPEALRALRRDLRILVALESQLAAAAISFKLVDCLTALTKRDFKQALSDIWASSCVVRRNVYKSLSERYRKTSDRAIAAECSLDDCDYEQASVQYMKANIEITKGTNIEILFEEPNDENS